MKNLRVGPDREKIAVGVFGHALGKQMTWRHGVRDIVRALAAVDAGEEWRCEMCGASIDARVGVGRG